MSENTPTTETIETVDIDETEETQLTVAEVVEDLMTEADETVGPYAIWKVLRAAAEVLEIDVQKVTSQYMYNYSRNGMIAKRTEKPNKDHVYTKDQATAFLVKYLEKRA